jgi:hypothetical protein
MDVSILRIRAESNGVRRISEIEEDKTAKVTAISRSCPYSDSVVELFVNDDIVASSERKIGEVASQVLGVVEDNGCTGCINVKELESRSETGG